MPARAPCEDIFPHRASGSSIERSRRRSGSTSDGGRLDESPHPFTCACGLDVRLTTRYRPDDLRCGLFATLHEVGHGLYEQGLEREAWGTPRGAPCSFGVHESQARFWGNHVGRSRGFWSFLLPWARRYFPALELEGVDAALRAANELGRSLIRTDADEVTHPLHIVIRSELEDALLAGELAVEDLPDAWAAKTLRYLGLAPREHREGVLQDVHWAMGEFGYFPAYAIGDVYGAVLARAVERDLGPVGALAEEGCFPEIVSCCATGCTGGAGPSPASS